jgi:hypothetical protein
MPHACELRKHFYYEGSDMLYLDSDYEQEGMVRGSCPFNFNDGSDDSLTDDEIPDITQVIEGQPSVAECAAAALEAQASHL